jgi:hypothetical protein
VSLVLGGLVVLVLLVAIHFLLIWMESKNWIYYRRTPKHGGSAYHLMHMSSIFDPKFKQVMEIMVEEERQEDESGEGKVDDLDDGDDKDDEW